MGDVTAIAWTDHTFNPWWGCARVSPGCEHCYAEALSNRTGRAKWGKNGERAMASEKVWRSPFKWDREAEAAGRPALVFCASMADVFEDRPELVEPRARVFELIVSTPNLIWQLLTKRPENVRPMVPPHWLNDPAGPSDLRSDSLRAAAGEDYYRRWPTNCWIGTTVEDQQRAEERIPHLLDLPAPVRFLSCEPLLGPVSLRPWLRRISSEAEDASEYQWDTSHRIDWIIVGGESGAGHRPLDLDHARAIRDEAAHWSVPLLFKQVGGHHPTTGGDLLDGHQYKAFPSAAQR